MKNTFLSAALLVIAPLAHASQGVAAAVPAVTPAAASVVDSAVQTTVAPVAESVATDAKPAVETVTKASSYAATALKYANDKVNSVRSVVVANPLKATAAVVALTAATISAVTYYMNNADEEEIQF